MDLIAQFMRDSFVFTISKQYKFEAAHMLPSVPAGHPCGRLHGHSYQVIVEVTGKLTKPNLWVVDYAAINQVMDPIIASLDHQYLNELPGLENPTAEMLCLWFVERLHSVNLGGNSCFTKITVKETAKTAACLNFNEPLPYPL